MVFSNFTRITSGNEIIFKNSTPILNVDQLKFYKDNASGIFTKKEFRWSFNGNYWASWETLNQGNLSNIKINGNQYLFLEIRYVPSGSGKVTKFEVNYTKTSENSSVPSSSSSSSTSTSTNMPSQGQPCPTEYNTTCSEDTIIDADLLQGQPGSYYLWRPNHKGQQPISSITDLQSILTNLSNAINNATVKDAMNVDGPGIGVYYNRIDKTLYFKTLVEGNKIFLSETPQGHITIEVDDASITELFQELGSLNGVNIGGGEGEIFKQRSGNDFQFRTIAAGNANVNVTTVGDQIRISLDASASGAPTWSDTDPVSATVGGISGGDDVSVGSNSIEILEKILYEYYPPNINFNIDPSPGYYEKGQIAYDVSLYGTFNTNNYVKVEVTDVSAYDSLNGGIGHISYPNVGSGSFNFSSTGNSNWDDVVYSIKVYHKVGSTQLAPTDASLEIKYVKPYIWGVVDNNVNVTNIDSSIIEYLHTQGNKLIVPEQSNEIDFQRPSGILKSKFVYAYDASYGNINSIFDVKNDFNVTTSFDSTIINGVTLGSLSNQSYKVYIKSHWIDVSSFKLIFNI